MCSVLDAIKELELPAEAKIWIAFSGGLDSTVLLHACVQVLGFHRCRALHINHNLSPTSENWVKHCTRIAQQWGVLLNVDSVKVSLGNMEQQARLSRYAIFRNQLGPRETLLTAHHRDDDIETLFWQMFTGRAMIGIPTQRRLGTGTVSRPLLKVKKQEMEAYAKQRGLTWIEDESNAYTQFDRNWIRHELLPDLVMRFPQAKDQILKLKIATPPMVAPEPLEIKNSSFTVDDVRSWLLAYEVNPPSSVLSEILLQASAHADANPEIKVGEGLFVRRYRERLHLVRSYEVFQPVHITVGTSASLSNGTLTWKEATEGFEEGCTMFCTNRRHLKNDQRVIKHGGMHKKFAKLFQDSSIPLWLRDGWPVLCEGDAVVSLVGVKTDTTAHGWQTKPAFVPSWHPYE